VTRPGGLRVEATAVVGDQQPDLVLAPPQLDGESAGAGVLGRVAERPI
jgi:hypothetical protein